VPTLGNDEVDRSIDLRTIIIRLLELARSPASATIRNTDLSKRETIIKNQVDFVVLDNIYRRDESYKKMSISGLALSQGRRLEKVPRTASKTKKIVTDEIITGYELAETLCQFVKTRKFKSPENECFASFILDLLKLISDKVDISTYQLPASFLTPPAARMRQLLRKGPTIKTKRGEKANLYVPFSFAKASECTLMPEDARKKLTETGADILKNIDLVNKLQVKDASEKFEDFSAYLKRSYIVADECRKQWRAEGKIPDYEGIKRTFVDDFPKLSGNQVKSFDDDTWKQYFDGIMSFKTTFTPTKQSPEEQKALMASVIKIQEDKRKKRT